MAKRRGREEIPESFDSLEEAGEFWDTHSAADYKDLLHEAHFNVQIDKTPQYIHLDREIAEKVFNLAKNNGISADVLVNTWLKEKLAII
jgi:23S rRNA G2445 N2-methylase RlmL